MPTSSARPSWTLLLLLSAFAVPTLGQVVTATLPTGMQPFGIAVNQVTNKIYVSNLTCSQTPPCPSAGTVTVVDGATNNTAAVNVGVYPLAVVVNSATNKIYVVNNCGGDVNCASIGTVTVIDGVTNNTTNVNVGYFPEALAVNAATNKIYVANRCGSDSSCASVGTVTVIDGNTNQTSTLNVGWFPVSVAVNATTNKIYVVNECGNDRTCGSVGTVSVIDANNNNSISTVQAGYFPIFVDLDSLTNKIYVANNCGTDVSCSSAGTVTVIDGNTNATATVNVGFFPYNLAVNSASNKIYVPNFCGDDVTCASIGTITIIDGSNNTASEITSGYFPWNVAVNATTNKIYVPNYCGTDPSCSSAGNVNAIDGTNNSIVPVAVGDGAENPVVNSTTNTIYVTNILDDTVSVIGGGTSMQLINITPCRVVDTRGANGIFGGPPMTGGTVRNFPIPQGPCSIPATAAAYALNVTVVPMGRLGYLTIWPQGELQPLDSLLNSPDGRIKANAAIVPAGVDAGVSVYVTNTTNVVIDIDGYFAPANDSSLAFYPLPPCRIVDTRGQEGDLGGPFLQARQERDFPILESSCIPSGVTPAAYSFNVTAVPHPAHQQLGYLTVWPVGVQQPVVSTLNNPTGTIVANAAIVPAGTSGAIAVFPNNTTDLLIDINGYFGTPGTGGLSLHPIAPCRVIDTRGVGNGQPFQGELTVNVINSPCSPPANAQAYVFNATVVPPGGLGYLTLWPDGADQPLVSTLNAIDGSIASNMAIVPTSNGSIDAYASALTQLILDISSYFAP